MPTEEYPERPSTKRIGMLIIFLVVVTAIWVMLDFNFFDEPEEPEGIFVRFILLFKQSMLL